MLPRRILGWHRENIFCDRVGSLPGEHYIPGARHSTDRWWLEEATVDEGNEGLLKG